MTADRLHDAAVVDGMARVWVVQNGGQINVYEISIADAERVGITLPRKRITMSPATPDIRPEPCPDDLPPCPDDTTARIVTEPGRALVIERDGAEVWRCWMHRGDWWSRYPGDESPSLHTDAADAMEWIRNDLGHELPELARWIEAHEALQSLAALQEAADNGWCFTCGDTTTLGHHAEDCLQHGMEVAQ